MTASQAPAMQPNFVPKELHRRHLSLKEAQLEHFLHSFGATFTPEGTEENTENSKSMTGF